MSDKDQVIHELGSEILKSNRLTGEDWVSLALVIDLAKGRFSQSGYLYLVDEVKPFIAKSDDPLVIRHICKQLADIVNNENENEIVQMLVQLRACDQNIDIHFEYDDKTRWSITPKNMNEMKKIVRPE